MNNLKDSIPWFISISTGMFTVWGFFLVLVAAIYKIAWAETLMADDYLITFSLVLVSPTLLWWGRCTFRRKWAFIAVSMSALIGSVFMVFYLMGFFLMAAWCC